MRTRICALAALALAGAGCGTARDSEPPITTPAACTTTTAATLSSIEATVFQRFCHVCHSPEGGVSGGLDLKTDAHAALVGVPANNLGGTDKTTFPLRVEPLHPERSFLVKKLGLAGRFDPAFGSGMPFSNPGAVCPDSLRAIEAWIASGAQRN